MSFALRMQQTRVGLYGNSLSAIVLLSDAKLSLKAPSSLDLTVIKSHYVYVFSLYPRR